MILPTEAKDVLWMLRDPMVGPQRGVVRLAGQESVEPVLHVRTHVEVVPQRAAGQRQEGGCTLARLHAAHKGVN
ncbi:MAG: hypothetical protein RBS80_12840 [Thermoguttaceae bacterium]|jgi:hypothetical protein|nr:hypothetical protein [Thermoguttaceae bacterium]